MFQYTKLLLGYIKMRIDIIVPNFDSSSDEVTLSAWYKAVGDTISKGEVIADAETATVACGITSSYDCILAKILIKEGEMISPGTKIAVIETDMAAVESVIREAQQEEMLENDKAIAEELKDEAQIAAEQEIQEQQEQLQHEFRMLKRDEMLRAIEPDNNQNDTKGYSLSVPLDDENNEEIIEEESAYEDQLSAQEEESSLHYIAEQNEKEEQGIVKEFSKEAEEKLKHMLKDAERNAQQEAQILQERLRMLLQLLYTKGASEFQIQRSHAGVSSKEHRQCRDGTRAV